MKKALAWQQIGLWFIAIFTMILVLALMLKYIPVMKSLIKSLSRGVLG